MDALQQLPQRQLDDIVSRQSLAVSYKVDVLNIIGILAQNQLLDPRNALWYNRGKVAIEEYCPVKS
jgi:hypothetical protein